MLKRRVPLNQRSFRPGHGNELSGALRATVMVESAISIRLRPRSQLKSESREGFVEARRGIVGGFCLGGRRRFGANLGGSGRGEIVEGLLVEIPAAATHDRDE